jgi:hypothetical protein
LIFINIDYASLSYIESKARIQTKDGTKVRNLSWIFSDKSKAEPFKESLEVKGYDVESDYNKKKNPDMWDYMLKGKNSQKAEKINNIFNKFLDKF